MYICRHTCNHILEDVNINAHINTYTQPQKEKTNNRITKKYENN